MSGYHGYWFTDHYEIDKRFGGKEAYLKIRAGSSRPRTQSHPGRRI